MPLISALLLGTALSFQAGTDALDWRGDWDQARSDAALTHRPMLIVFR